MKIIWKKYSGWIIVFVLEGILIALLENGSAAYYQVLVDHFADRMLSLTHVLLYGAILIGLCLLNYLDEYPTRKLENGSYLELKVQALGKISRIDYASYQRLGTGQLIQQIENGAQAGRDILMEFGLRLVREILPSIGFSVLLIYQLSPAVMYAILAGYGLVFIITNLLLRGLYRIKERILNHEELLSRRLVRGFMELAVFRLNRRFSREIAEAEAAKEEIVSAKTKMRMIHEAFFAIFALLIILVKIGLIWYGWSSGALTIGAVIALMALVDKAYTPVAIFNVVYVQYKLDRAAYERYQKLMELPEDQQLSRGSRPASVAGTIEFDSVSFSYEGRPILSNLSLTIPGGQKVALVGESGSGKSTLIQLLAGLLKPRSGQILIGGQPLSEMALDTYYQHMCYISQESPVFDGTLKENITFDTTAQPQKVHEALRAVALEDLAEKIGLEAPIGERGTQLSGGERQRLALARLWMSEAELVILDEATSALDNLTEERVMKAVLAHLANRTVVSVAHRLSQVKAMDRILVFRAGRIVEDGSFEELMSRDGYFRRLYDQENLQ